jgi:type I restriction enzyme S subunit
VHSRLLNRSRETREDFQFLLQRYAAERFLYRLGESAHRGRYVLKGATLFAIWGGAIYRGTRDLDFTGYGTSEAGGVHAAMRDVFAVPVADDGLTFDVGTLMAKPIRDGTEYNGLRVQFQAKLGAARIPMQVDIGFGNAIEPPPTEVDYPTLLDLPAPRIRAYPQEAVVAEKLHAMVVLGERNSRYKDFYDLYVFARQFPFDGERLTRAIGATFERRHTAVEPTLPAVLTPRFYADDERAAQWRAYLTRNSLPGAPADWIAVGELLQAFLLQPYRAIADGRGFSNPWSPGGPWAASLTPGPVIAKRVQCALQQLRPYPAYKDSGIEWLGKIPACWEVKALKRIGDLQGGAGFPEDEQGVTNEDIPFFKVGDMASAGNEREMLHWQHTVSEATARRLRAFVFPPGTIVFAKIGAALMLNRRRTLIGPSCIDNNMMGFMPDECDATWAMYWLSGLDLGKLANPGAVPSVNEGQMQDTPAIVPPLSEQRAVAAFLDQETARIDALVEKKEQLIALLQEKRTAVITRAVTKGLDPNVPMRDSGVEWLGEIPAHWECLALARVTVSRCDGPFGSGLKSEHYSNEGVRVIRLQNIGWAEFLDSDEAYIDEVYASGLGDHSVVPDDLLIAGLGDEGHPVGRACSAPSNIEPAMVKADCFRFRLDRRRLISRFAAYQLSATASATAGSLSTGATRSRLNLTNMAARKVAVPPLDEQRAIVELLEQNRGSFHTLLGRIREAIDRLKELRIALISAAVTGKIDVREEAA